ncbi:MAG: sensor histidine kinase [Verrucomicrobiales bacterium]
MPLLLLLLSLVTLTHQLHGELLTRTWQSSDGLPGNVVLDVAQDHEGYLWVATTEGMARFDGLQFEHLALPPDFIAQRLRFHRIHTGKENGVEVTTTSELRYRVVDQALVLVEEEKPPGKSSPTPTLTDLPDVYAREISIAPYHPNRFLFTLPDRDNPLVVNNFFLDREGNLWLASNGHGLLRLKPSRFIYLDQQSERELPHPRTALRDRSGTWWLASLKGGLDQFGPAGLRHHFLPGPAGSEDHVVGLMEDKRGRLWIRSDTGKIYLRHQTAEEIEPFEVPGLPRALTMAEAGEDRIVFAGAEGIIQWQNGAFEDLSQDKGLGIIRPTVIAPHPGGGLLVGTRDGRVIFLGQRRITDLAPPDQLKRSYVSALLTGPGGELWVATLGAGIFRRHQEEWEEFGRAEGLPDLRITTLFLSADDELWCGSLSGVLSVKRSDLIARDQANARWRVLDQSEGMRTRECNGTVQPGHWLTPDGTLWFPTARGLAGVRPETGESLPAPPPPIYLRKLLLSGEDARRKDGFYLGGPGPSRIEAHFQGLNYGSPEKTRYRVRLAGHETTSSLSERTTASYDELPPGDYHLEVTAINGHGIASTQPLRVPIRITPYLWQKPWFLATAAAALLLLTLLSGIAIMRVRTRRKIALLHLQHGLAEERSRISRDLHDELGAKLTELSIIASLSAEKAAGEAQSGEPLENIAAKARQVVITLDEIVWAVSPEEDSLRSLIDYLCAYGREFVNNAGLAYHCEVPPEIPELVIGPKRRHHLCMATREALNNAIKHARASEISLHAGLDAEYLHLRVRDNGRGLDDEARHRGHGLSNFHQRLAACGGKSHLDSSPGTGTIVTLSIPLKQRPAQP